MKKKKIIFLFMTLLFICLIAGGCDSDNPNMSSDTNGDVEINEVTFPETILRDTAMEADQNKDNLLSMDEASTITELNIKKLADSDIVDAMEDEELPEYTNADFSFDFEGIQHFTSLTKLDFNMLGGERFNTESNEEEILAVTKNFDCAYELSGLTQLKLYEFDGEDIDISRFPKLKRLELHFAYNLTSLSFEKQEDLKNIWISDSDQLEELNLSSLGNLEELYLISNSKLQKLTFGDSNTALETIDLEHLENLTTLDCTSLSNLKHLNLTDVPLTGLDVSQNSLLEDICAEEMSMDTLDLTNNPKITYIINSQDSFQTIVLSDDNIVNMIRWINSDITEFPIKNLNPETLEGIDIQGTKIAEIDVTQYKNLQYFYYDDTTNIIGYER